MRKLLTFGLLALLLAAGAVYWYWNADVDPPLVAISALEKTGEACDTIAHKAAMELPEALPFQKLEKAARTMRVLETCMQDRGYVENPAWVKWAEPLAQKNAVVQKVSLNEAYETLRRKAMLTFKISRGEVTYWMPTKNVV